jgi:adenine-specific DNA-methyltransferase
VSHTASLGAVNADSGEDPSYLAEQVITYIGNKRALLGFIGQALDIVRDEIGRERLSIADVFSGSGVVSRFFKRFASALYANDQERYCRTLNACYLANRSEIDMASLRRIHGELIGKLTDDRLERGFISELYAPRDDHAIQPGERAFYTARNAMYIDTARRLIEELPAFARPFLLAPLIYEASVHANTSGVFKGFYKNSETGLGQFGGNGRNALSRILGDISLPFPVFSRFACDVHLSRLDAGELASRLPAIDLAYLDPPYNQHPYGSNYFMLNLILKNKLDVETSPVSGITQDWNRSAFNKHHKALSSLEEVVANLDAKFVIVSYNSEGFISFDSMSEMLRKYGTVKTVEIPYNTFRGSRNLHSRLLHVSEYLFVLEK